MILTHESRGFAFRIIGYFGEPLLLLGVSLVTSATNTPSSFALPFAYLTGCFFNAIKIKRSAMKTKQPMTMLLVNAGY